MTTIENAKEMMKASMSMYAAAERAGDDDLDTCEWTAHEDTFDLALLVCRGWYQRQVVLGNARLSGSDLKGKARRFSGRYAASRANLLARLRAVGIEVGMDVVERRHVLTLNGFPC